MAVRMLAEPAAKIRASTTALTATGSPSNRSATAKDALPESPDSPSKTVERRNAPADSPAEKLWSVVATLEDEEPPAARTHAAASRKSDWHG